MREYEDIINMPRHISEKRRPMGRRERAAQFSPFAALTGYDAVIAESGRLTKRRIELSEDSRSELDRKHRFLLAHIKEQPEICIEFFLPDDLKEGGEYVKLGCRVKKIDCTERCLLLCSGKKIPMEDIISMEGDFFDRMKNS